MIHLLFRFLLSFTLWLAGAPITVGIIVTFMFYIFFNSLPRSRYLSLFSHFLISFWDPLGQQIPQFFKFSCFFFVVDYNKIWSSGRDLVIRLDMEIPEKFVRFILLNRFWVVHIPFTRLTKLQLLAQFPVDHLAHPVMPSLMFSLC